MLERLAFMGENAVYLGRFLELLMEKTVLVLEFVHP